MLKKSGKHIKTVVKVVYVIYWIAAVLALAGAVYYAVVTEEPLIAVAGIAGAAAVIFIAWLGSLAMYAYGEIAESAVEMNETLKELLRLQQEAPRIQTVPAPAPAPAQDPVSTRTQTWERPWEPAPAVPAAPVEPPVAVPQAIEWKCPNCGKMLQEDHRFCDNCGAPRQ